MSLEAIYFISQIVAAFALIASLFFVGMQLRQTDKTQRAAMHQARAQRNMDLCLRLAEPHNAELMSKVRAGETRLTQAELHQLHCLFRCHAVDVIDIYWQNSQGMIDDTVTDIAARTFKGVLSAPAFRALWCLIRERFLPVNRNRIDALVAGTPVAFDGGSMVTGWDDAVAGVMAEAGKEP